MNRINFDAPEPSRLRDALQVAIESLQELSALLLADSTDLSNKREYREAALRTRSDVETAMMMLVAHLHRWEARP